MRAVAQMMALSLFEKMFVIFISSVATVSQGRLAGFSPELAEV
jgi:hypothetical protein